MQISLTGATGFLGRYVVDSLLAAGHSLRCSYRDGSDRSDFPANGIEWIEAELGDSRAAERLVAGSDALVHAALWHPAGGFQGGEGDVVEFAERNVIGSLQLFEAARTAGVGRVVFVSTCAVHDRILNDRPLDETHPLWPHSHYGAHKAALEAFVSSFAFGHGLSICAIRPTGIYGVATPPEQSKWWDLVRRVAAGESVECRGGGKEVHVADVAAAITTLLTASGVEGNSYACYDRYISRFEVAEIAKELSGSRATILGEASSPKNQIETKRIRDLGVRFGGTERLRSTIAELLQS
ncbi:NAD-dependent epimerase/dehydratase family protein [Candidatus Laterigemmans baculatus]|uniref:NAD-dependent epimerase/dehydratase family protein n=1 Tax=Candidatus Laterigemmans baculatus TaxID=2770505 RepID=UPI0013D9FF36|nr:NAD(P)-dependent oxidoreductase [Candidatus Laterigemmans baculatus]